MNLETDYLIYDETLMFSATETNHLMMFRELIGVCSENDNETHKCTLLAELKISYC